MTKWPYCLPQPWCNRYITFHNKSIDIFRVGPGTLIWNLMWLILILYGAWHIVTTTILEDNAARAELKIQQNNAYLNERFIFDTCMVNVKNQKDLNIDAIWNCVTLAEHACDKHGCKKE